MKPFNLQKALAGEPVVFGNGKECLEIKQFKNGVVVSLDEFDVLRKHEKDGALYALSPSDISNYSLFMAEKPKVKKEGWVNVYREGGLFPYNTSRVYFEEQSAIESAIATNHIATIKIEWEEEE